MGNIIRNLKFSTLFILYITLIIFFGTLFFLLSASENNGIYKEKGIINLDVGGYLEALYFSFATSTSIGYGDIRPMGISRVFSIIEVVVSLIIFGILISKLLSKNQERILEELYDVSFQERFTRIVSGLYNFRAEIQRMTNKAGNLKKEETEEFLQNIEYNLHLLSSYLADSEKILVKFRKNPKQELDFKEDIILDNVHNSLSNLEELFTSLKTKKISCRRKPIINNLALILDSTEKICRRCVDLDYANMREITKEVERHSKKLEKVL